MTSRTRWVLIAVIVASFGAVAWWLGSPLFLDRTVNEDFPRTAAATIPDTMTRQDAEEIMASTAERRAEISEAMPDGEPRAIKRGAFEDADSFHRGSGQATIYLLPDGRRILRFENFRVTNGPDLRVLLTGHAGPSRRADLDTAGYVEVGSLKGNVGNQNYDIPESVDLDAQSSVVIYCRPFHVVFSVAPLVTVE